jgi:CheY-like chemotaxis protein
MQLLPFVFIVSADAAWLAAIKPAVAEVCELNVFSSLAACRGALQATPPVALVLDADMPGEDALGFLAALKDDFDTADIRVLLLASPAVIETQAVAADDFLLKPFSPPLFQKRFAYLIKALAEAAQVRSQMSYAQGVAMTAMSSMGELGVVMDFMSKSFARRTIQSVSDLALASLKQFDLDCVVHFAWAGESYTARTDALPVLPEDREHLVQMRGLGRLLEINEQLIVNYEHTSVLVRRLPDDLERRGRLRDNVATLCEGVESRVIGLLLEHDNLLKQQGIRYAVCEIRDSVANLYERQMADLASGRQLMGRVIDDFEETFSHLALMPEVENALIGQLVSLRQQISALWERPAEVEARLRSVIAALETLAGEAAGDNSPGN